MPMVPALSQTPFVATLYGYGSYDGYGSPAGLALGGYAPSYLAVYATGANSTRLYWNTVQNAAQYQIYRTQTPGQYDFSQPPIATVAGTAHYWDDSGLQANWDYNYVVRTVLSDGSSFVSEEDDDVTTANAIPWNGSSGAILQAAYGISGNMSFNDEYGNEYFPDFNALTVIAPDNTIYNLEAPYINENPQYLPPPKIPPPSGVAEVRVKEGSGAVRRLATVSSSSISNENQKYTGVAGTFYIPPYSQSLVMPPAVVTNPDPNVADKAYVSAHVYVGILGELDGKKLDKASPTIDAGAVYAPAGKFKPYDSTQVSSYPARWTVAIRVADGRGDGYPTDKRRLQSVTVENVELKAWVRADSQYGVFVNTNVQLTDIKACKIFYVAGDGSRVVNVPVIVAQKGFAAKRATPDQFGNFTANHVMKNYRMKRVVSVDQKVDYVFSPLFNRATMPGVLFARAWKMFNGAYQDGSALKGVTHRAYLMKRGDPTTWFRWTSAMTDHFRTNYTQSDDWFSSARYAPVRFPDAFAMDFMAQWITNTSAGGPVRTTPTGSNGLYDELVNIILR